MVVDDCRSGAGPSDASGRDVGGGRRVTHTVVRPREPHVNRRTVLRTAGVAATASLAGCIESLQEHYQGSFQGLVPLELHSEAERHYDVALEAFAMEEDRQTYDKSFTVRAGETVSAPHLDAIEQRFRATKFGREDDQQTTEEATITPNADLVTVRITDDELRLDVKRGDEDDATGSEPDSGPAGQNETDGSEPNETDT